MSNKAYLEFEGFNEAIARLNKLNANTKNISEKSLKKTHEIITKKAQEAITPHNETKRTEKALKKEAEIEWAGTLASVKVGFSISEGGLASIFLMYGTQSHSVSNQYGKNLGIMAEHKKDKKMYNAIFGTSTSLLKICLLMEMLFTIMKNIKLYGFLLLHFILTILT